MAPAKLQPTECLCNSNRVQKCVWINDAEKHKNVIGSAVGSLHNDTLNYLIHLIQYHLIMFLLNLALKASTVVFVALQTHVLLTKKVQSDFFWWSQCSSHGWRVFLFSRAEAYPCCHRARDGVHSGQAASLRGWNRETETFTPMTNFTTN